MVGGCMTSIYLCSLHCRRAFAGTCTRLAAAAASSGRMSMLTPLGCYQPVDGVLQLRILYHGLHLSQALVAIEVLMDDVLLLLWFRLLSAWSIISSLPFIAAGA